MQVSVKTTYSIYIHTRADILSEKYLEEYQELIRLYSKLMHAKHHKYFIHSLFFLYATTLFCLLLVIFINISNLFILLLVNN